MLAISCPTFLLCPSLSSLYLYIFIIFIIDYYYYHYLYDYYQFCTFPTMYTALVGSVWPKKKMPVHAMISSSPVTGAAP